MRLHGTSRASDSDPTPYCAHQMSFERWVRRATALTIILFAARGVRAQKAYEAVSLVEKGGVLGAGWAVGTAEFQGALYGSTSLIRTQNTLPATVHEGGFYAEYFDRSGRFCFTLLFSDLKNLEHRNGPFLPGEWRTLLAHTYYLTPAVRPSAVTVFRVTNPVDGGSATVAPGAVVRSPVMLDGSDSAEWPPQGLGLGHEIEGARGPVVDLVLARVTVDGEGHLEGSTVLAAKSSSVASWFDDFIRHQRFRPSARDGVEHKGDALILVRAIVSLRCTRQLPLPVWNSPLIESFLEDFSGSEVPPVIAVYLEPDSPEFWAQPSHPGHFRVIPIGAGWATPDPDQRDQGSEGPAGPPLRKILPPPGSDSCP
jgi:hypothetical protein